MNGMYMMIYVTEEGGMFKALEAGEGIRRIRRVTKEEYEQVLLTGELDVNLPWETPRVVKPIFVALARVESNWDFINGASRG